MNMATAAVVTTGLGAIEGGALGGIDGRVSGDEHMSRHEALKDGAFLAGGLGAVVLTAGVVGGGLKGPGAGGAMMAITAATMAFGFTGMVAFQGVQSLRH
jgi:hypothetical protein